MKHLLVFLVAASSWAAVPNVGGLNWEIETAGSNTANAGCATSITMAGMATDGAATSAATSAPVFTSASYNFVAGDVGAWVLITAGTNWTPGWYKIASVASNAATLDAAIGHATLFGGPLNSQFGGATNTVVGAATTGSPTGATWAVDYSRSATPIYSLTDLVAATTTTITSASHSFGKNDVGNCIVITSGTGWTTGTYQITAASGGTATVERAIATMGSTGGNGAVGGAIATLAGFLAPNPTFGNNAWIQAGTYTTSSRTDLRGSIEYSGYSTVRGDGGHATISSTTASNYVIASTGGNSNWSLQHFTINCNSTAGSTGVALYQDNVTLYDVTAQNCATGFSFQTTVGGCYVCTATGTLSGAGFGFDFTTGGAFRGPNICYICVAVNNLTTGFSLNQTTCIMCISGNNTGATTDCYVNQGNFTLLDSVAYTCGRDGLRFLADSNTANVTNTIFYGNAGVGLNQNGKVNAPSTSWVMFNNAYGSNTGGNYSGVPQAVGDLFLTADPFTNGAGNNFALDNTAGGGKALRGTGFPGTLPTGGTGSISIGALQPSSASGTVSYGFTQ